MVACAGTGHDGEIQAGATLAYVDNDDGTITDLNTGLMWEKKSDDGSIHDKDNFYTWDNAFAVHVAGLNTASFAGYTDWRVPNYKELVSIIDLEVFQGRVDPVFNTDCDAGCTVTTCSCLGVGPPNSSWSSSSGRPSPTFAYTVDLVSGSVDPGDKGDLRFVRAVRGGL